jgi:hypothetical protein
MRLAAAGGWSEPEAEAAVPAVRAVPCDPAAGACMRRHLVGADRHPGERLLGEAPDALTVREVAREHVVDPKKEWHGRGPPPGGRLDAGKKKKATLPAQLAHDGIDVVHGAGDAKLCPNGPADQRAARSAAAHRSGRGLEVPHLAQ